MVIAGLVGNIIGNMMRKVNLEVSTFIRKDYKALVHKNYDKTFIGYIERNCLQPAVEITRNVEIPIILEVEQKFWNE